MRTDGRRLAVPSAETSRRRAPFFPRRTNGNTNGEGITNKENMSPKHPPQWLCELWYAMDTAKRLLNARPFDPDSRWEAQDAYDTMNRYVRRCPTGQYVDECRDLCSRLERLLPNEFGDDE